MSKLPDPFREGLARGWKATHGEQGLPSQIECDVAIVGTGAGGGTAAEETSGGSNTGLIIGLVIAALVIVGLVIALVRMRSKSSEDTKE